MREDAFTTLGVIDRTARQISTDRDTNHHRAGESIVGAPADRSELVADLHHRRPDVVEELNFDDGLQPARGHASGAADYSSLGERRIENAVIAEFVLQAEGKFEHPAFALDQLLPEVLFAAAIGDVFAEDHDA